MAGLQKLNKTNFDKYVPIVGSDPNNPIYGGGIEVLHQLHCLVSSKPFHVLTNISRMAHRSAPIQNKFV